MITIDDIVDIIREEAGAEMKALGGVSDKKDYRPMWWAAKRRSFGFR